MSGNFTGDIAHLVETTGRVSYIVIFLIAFFERTAFTGIIVPGGYFLALAGYLAGHGYMRVSVCMAAALAGAVLGDSAGYLEGRLLGKKYFKRHKRLFLIKREHVNLVEEYFRDRKGRTILIGRFVSFLHTLVPFVSGMSIDYGSFLLYDAMGNLGWALLFTGLGYVVGRSARHIGGWMPGVGLFFLMVLAILVMSYVLKLKRKRPG